MDDLQRPAPDMAPDSGAEADRGAAATTPGVATGRRVLLLGALGVSAAATIRPAFASTAVSVLNCQLPVPDPPRSGQWIAADGSLVPGGTRGAFPGAMRPFTGEEVKAAMAGRTLPGTTRAQSQAYLKYIRTLRPGQSGFTCFASVQMPRI